jgi:prepilin-type N-terminal cleavage/methylation domain-containing protein
MTPITTRARPGMTIIEVMFAVVIMSGVMLALSRFGSAFSQATREAAVVGIASDLATARLEVIRAFPNYDSLSKFVQTETNGAAYPPMPSTGFSRATEVATRQTKSGARVILEYKTVTVTVRSTGADSTIVTKSVDIAKP